MCEMKHSAFWFQGRDRNHRRGVVKQGVGVNIANDEWCESKAHTQQTEGGKGA